MTKLQRIVKHLICLAFVFSILLASNKSLAEVPSGTPELSPQSPSQMNTQIDNYDDSYDLDYAELDYEPNKNNNSSKIWDPWEKANRKIFNFNIRFLDYVAHPLYYGFYVKITTPNIRKSVHNISNNFKMPINFLNYALQLDFKNSAKSIYSFILDSTFGVFGIFDISGHQGVKPSNTGLGITLAKYRVPSGPYIVIPFFGASDIRGTLSWGGEFAVDPFGLNLLKIGGKREMLDDWIYWTKSTLFVLDSSTYVMENFYDLIHSSFDPYIMMRDAYEQSQAYKIKKARGE